MTEKSCSDDILKELNEEIRRLKKIIFEYEKTLSQYEIEEIDQIDDVEFICIEEIKKLKELSNISSLTEDEVKKLDILHKNLRLVRGQESKKKGKQKEVSVEDLLKIVDND